MHYTIEHELPGRLRIRLNGTVRPDDADAIARVYAEHHVRQDVLMSVVDANSLEI